MKLKYIASAVVACGLLQACDYTDLKPLEGFSDPTFWNTVDDLELYATGLFGNFGGASSTGDSESDNMVPATISSYLFDTYVTANASGWSYNDWSTIRQCNYFLNRYQRVEGNEADINKYVAEVRMIRALAYYSKVRTFGNVPWYESDLQTNDEELLYKTQDPRSVVVPNIIADLEFAAQWLPDGGNEVMGRPSKDAARALLARVCLYFGTYVKYHNANEECMKGCEGLDANALLKKAADASQAIMNTGKYDIVKVDAPSEAPQPAGDPLYYHNLFIQTQLWGNKENIFARYYTINLVTNEVGRQEGKNNLGFSKDFAMSYLMKNGLPIANAGSGYKGDDSYADEFDGRDPRMIQTIGNAAMLWYPSEDYPRRDLLATANGACTGYSSWKFHSSDYEQQQPQSCTFDWFLFRYAETLLINAEANAELGTCTQDVLDNTVNKLRDRVGMAHLTTSPVADAAPVDYGYSVSPLIYEIRRERRVELAHEGFRMDDLKRWNAMKLLENPLTFLGIKVTPQQEAFFAVDGDFSEEYIDEETGQPIQTGITFGGDNGLRVISYNGDKYLMVYGNEPIYPEGRKWKTNDKRWLYPIPLTQLQYNKNLVQNYGWDVPSAE